MNKSTVVEIGSREGIDPLNAMLISGARQLIASAAEVELQELLGRYEGRTVPGGYAAVVRNGLSARARATNRYWSCHGSHTEGAITQRRTGDVPLCTGAAVCAQDAFAGSGVILVVPEGRVQYNRSVVPVFRTRSSGRATFCSTSA